MKWAEIAAHVERGSGISCPSLFLMRFKRLLHIHNCDLKLVF